MFHQPMFRQPSFHQERFRTEVRLRAVAAILIVGITLLLCPGPALAQHGGGGGGHGMGSPSAGGTGRPDGVSEKDDLKDFHRAIAVQATADQRDAFAKIEQYLQDAANRLQALRESLTKAPASASLSGQAGAVNEAIEKARSGNQNFLTSFSPAQKSGLKDLTKKLAKADSELDKQTKTLSQAVQSVKPESEQVANSSASLEKALAGFDNEQLALGKEMSIILPTGGQELAINLPAVVNTVNFSGQAISISASGAISRAPETPSSTSGDTSVENGHKLFNLKLTADLTDLQQNITAILRSELNRYPRCGERTQIQQATITPQAPAGLLVADVHYERWVCTPGPSGASPMEVAAGDAEIEIKLTPSVDHKTGLVLSSEISRVRADGPLRNMLRSGDLGVTLREQIAATLVAALQKTADPKTTVPSAMQQSAVVQKAQFQDSGVAQLSLVLEGQLQLSDEQIAQFTAQLKQRQAAQGTPAP
jgi:hypothetical protein